MGFCTKLFTQHNIFLLGINIVLWLLLFVVQNLKKFQRNWTVICQIITSQNVKKELCFTGIKLFSSLLTTRKRLNQDIKVLKPALNDSVTLQHS